MQEHSNSTQTNKGGRKRTGSLQFRSGTWYAVLTCTVDGETIRKWTNLHTDSKPAARRKLARLLDQPEDTNLAQIAKAPETYEELANRVCKQRKLEGIVDTQSEKGRERLWILPEIGHLPVASVKAEHIIGIYENARQKGRSRAHLCHLRAILRSRLAVAAAEETITTSPMALVRIPKMKTDRRERAVLTDEELACYLAWHHPDENYALGVLERQVMSAIARVFGGLRTGDLHSVRWEQLDAPDFKVGVAPRKKTERPQRIAIPPMLRPILLQWWNETRPQKQDDQQPVDGLVFPALRGKHAGQGEKHHVSHAGGLRRDLRRVFGLDTWNPETHRFEETKDRKMTSRERELLVPTDMTKPVDFHSWRRAFVQALGDAGINAQQAQALSGHLDLDAHERYLHTTRNLLTIPALSLPDLGASTIPFYASKSQNGGLLVEPWGIEPQTSALRTRRSPS